MKLSVADNLRTMRTRSGLTCGGLAKLTDISENTILRHEHGYDMTVSQLFRYAEALECSINDILYGPLPPAGQVDESSDERFDAEIEELGRKHGLEVVFVRKEELHELL